MSDEPNPHPRSDNFAVVGLIALVFVPLVLVHLIANILVKFAGW